MGIWWSFSPFFSHTSGRPWAPIFFPFSPFFRHFPCALLLEDKSCLSAPEYFFIPLPKMNIWITILILLIVFIMVLILVCFIDKLGRIGKTKRKVISLDDLHKFACSGDLLLFSCHEFTWIPSWLRKGVYGTEWTHSGILYIDPKTKRAFLWEATI